MKMQFKLLEQREIEQIHEGSVQVLSRTGMRFETEKLLAGLEKSGARVDKSAQVAFFPAQLIEKTIENTKRLLNEGKKLHLLNGVTSEVTGGTAIAAKFSGGCEHYLDWKSQTLQEATAGELLRCIRLGELLPEVEFVGNPIVLRTDFKGNRIEERMRRVHTAALIAKNTHKAGSMEVWDEREIDLLKEMGIIIRDGEQAYRDRPCLVTAKETISPFFLDHAAGDILLALAERDLPCTVIPMPINGMSTPLSKLGNSIVGNAEILGVMTAIQSLPPDSLVGGGSISGVLDMRTGTASFSAPEAILQDIAVAEVHQSLYGLNYLIGSGYTDAKYPNSMTLAEKTLKFFLTYLSGRYSYPLGLNIHAHFTPSGRENLRVLVDLIAETGIRGNFMESEHTLLHFRDNFLPEIMDRTGFMSVEDSRSKDVYAMAHERVNSTLASQDFWALDPLKAKAIDGIVAHAEKIL
jgi:trimethylamine--corrinoid protein Co-methyltransferase